MAFWKKAARPVVLLGGTGPEVVGESHYQKELARVAGGKREESARLRVTAALVAEPRNPHDVNAIRVEVDGKLVGYLARPDAVRYQPVVARLKELGRVAACDAFVVGGWKRQDGDEGHFGIKLDLAGPDKLLRELRR